jgi:hypothetical protein
MAYFATLTIRVRSDCRIISFRSFQKQKGVFRFHPVDRYSPRALPYCGQERAAVRETMTKKASRHATPPTTRRNPIYNRELGRTSSQSQEFYKVRESQETLRHRKGVAQETPQKARAAGPKSRSPETGRETNRVRPHPTTEEKFVRR